MCLFSASFSCMQQLLCLIHSNQHPCFQGDFSNVQASHKVSGTLYSVIIQSSTLLHPYLMVNLLSRLADIEHEMAPCLPWPKKYISQRCSYCWRVLPVLGEGDYMCWMLSYCPLKGSEFIRIAYPPSQILPDSWIDPNNPLMWVKIQASYCILW